MSELIHQLASTIANYKPILLDKRNKEIWYGIRLKPNCKPFEIIDGKTHYIFRSPN